MEGIVNRVFVLGCLCILMLLTGCVDKRIAYQDVQAQEGKAVIYVYRPHSFINSAETMNTELNGADIGYLTNDGYRYGFAEPGEVTIVLKKNVIPYNEYGAITVKDIEAGKSYYIKADPIAYGGFDMILMDETQGRQEASNAGLFVKE